MPEAEIHDLGFLDDKKLETNISSINVFTCSEDTLAEWSKATDLNYFDLGICYLRMRRFKSCRCRYFWFFNGFWISVFLPLRRQMLGGCSG